MARFGIALSAAIQPIFCRCDAPYFGAHIAIFRFVEHNRGK